MDTLIQIITDHEDFEDYGDAPETCVYCRGQKFVQGSLGNVEHLQCRDCGIWTHRPVRNGVVITREEGESEALNG